MGRATQRVPNGEGSESATRCSAALGDCSGPGIDGSSGSAPVEILDAVEIGHPTLAGRHRVLDHAGKRATTSIFECAVDDRVRHPRAAKEEVPFPQDLGERIEVGRRFGVNLFWRTTT